MSQPRDLVEIRLESTQFDSEHMHLYRLRGREVISQLFEFTLDFVVPAHRGALDAEELLLSPASLVFSRNGEQERCIHGMIATVDQRYDIEPDDGRLYTLRFVPRAHTLTLVKTQDVFLDFSVPGLIEDKLSKHGLGAANVSMAALTADYPKREFIVQYRESDLAFISRLAEHLGVSFFFDHSDAFEQIVFCDSNDGFLAPERGATLQWKKREAGLGLYALRSSRNAIPDLYVMMDYNYRTPDVDLTSMHESEQGSVGGIVEWGSHHKTPEDGEVLAKIRAQAYESTKLTYHGASNSCAVSAGYVYRIEGHPDLDGTELLVTEVTHEAHQPTLLGFGQSEASGYDNHFKAIPAAQTYRPPRITPRPRITGLVHGVVEPKEMEEVEPNPRIDSDGRYWIKFLFDMVPLGERQASRPVRRAQPTVGPRYGMHFPLRPGIEVMMAFVNGDPDRPIVIGAVHNARTPNHVVANNSLESVIETVSGVKMTFRDPTLPRG